MADTTTNEDLSFDLFEREDAFGPYISGTDNSGRQPTLDDFPDFYTDEQRKGSLEVALKLMPEPETAVEMSRERSVRTQSMYLSFDSKFKEVQHARKINARWELSQDPEGPVTEQERKDYKTSDLALVHAHRVRKIFGNVSMSVLAGWAYDEDKEGNITAIHVKKDIAAAIKAAEDARKAAAASGS